jgi:hypothetical protein
MKKTFTFFLLFTSLLGFAQQPVLKRDVDENGIVNFMVFDNTTSFISFNQAKKLLHDTLKLGPDDDLILIHEMQDAYGFTHQSFE